MRFCNILIQYFLLIYFCLCHDLNHADPTTVKQGEASIPIVASVQRNENENVHIRSTDDTENAIENSNHARTTPLIDISSQNAAASRPTQTPPSITDTTKTIPISNDKTNLDKLPPTVQTEININEETDILSSSNTEPIDLNSNQNSQIPLKPVPNESHPSATLHSSTSKPPRKVQIHPRHIQTEDTVIADEPQISTDDLPNSTIIEKSTTKEDPNPTIPPVSIPDINRHLSRLSENQTNHSISIPLKTRQICWHLPKTFQPSIELLENQLFRLNNILPDFLQTIFFGRINDREVLMNTMWFGSICTMCCLVSVLFLSMGTKRLKQNKHEKEVRSRCQQLQQYNNQMELERATFERQNQKLFEQIDELKTLTVRDTDEDIFVLRTDCTKFQEEIKAARIERDTLQQDIDRKENLILKYEYEVKGQVEVVSHLNNQILQLKQDLTKERTTINRFQSNDLSLERLEKSQEQIQELKSTITQLKQEKFTEFDQLRELQAHSNQLDLENHQLTIRMKQLKDLLEQRDHTIQHFRQTIQTLDHFEPNNLLTILNEHSSNQNEDFLSNIDNDIEKSNQHIHDLHTALDEKTRRIKEIEILCKQEKDRCREMETKLKVVLELRERDAHLHIRQLGQSDAELRKARTDTDRVRILQQQMELKQQQFDDIQKVLSSEQIKFNEECSRLQHETHEKWMEVKRLTRELDASKKECEGLRKQITKYGNNERLSQEKTVIKPISPHFGDSENNSISPISYQQGENFRPIDHQRNDSGANSPAEMFITRPPMFGLSRPPFYPPHFMPPPHPNLFMMHPRFPMPNSAPHGAISPLPHLIVNSNDPNSSEMIDSSNLTPHSVSCDAQVNGAVASPVSNDEKPSKSKKSKKSVKKKTRPSAVMEDV